MTLVVGLRERDVTGDAEASGCLGRQHSPPSVSGGWVPEPPVDIEIH